MRNRDSEETPLRARFILPIGEFPQSLYCACPTDNVISNQLACATELIYLFDRDNETQFYQRGKIMGPNLHFPTVFQTFLPFVS